MPVGKLINGVVSGTLSNKCLRNSDVMAILLRNEPFLKVNKSEFSTKILITAGVTYASLYLFERLRYTKFKQEQLFRFQFG